MKKVGRVYAGGSGVREEAGKGGVRKGTGGR